MPAYKNVVIAGASGAVGSVVLQKFIDAGKFNIRVLKRAGSESKLPEGVEVVEVDYTSLDSLTAALKDQEVVISTLTTLAIDAQITFIDAAIAAGVQRFIPSEYGSNLDNASVRKLPVFTQKVQIQEILKEKAKNNQISYTFLYNSAFLDWGLQHNFILTHANSEPTLFDGGETEFSSTTLGSVGDALVGIVSHPDETKNRAAYISDIIITQKKLLELAQKVAPERPWKPSVVPLDVVTAKADERLAKGLYDMETFAPYLFRAIFDPKSEPKFVKNDNELLGVKGKTEEDIIEILKPLLK